MKTFTETIRINNNIRHLREMFVLMSRAGVDPMRFVDWYTTEGLEKQRQGLLVEASEEWLMEIWGWDTLKKGANWLGQGVKDIATGNVDYKAMGDRWKKGGEVMGNVLTAPIAAGTAMAGGTARGLLGSGASNLAGGVMGGLGLGGDNTTKDPATDTPAGGAAPPGGTPHGAGGAAPPGGTPHGTGGGKDAAPATPADPMAGPVKNAHSALDALSKRMGNSKNLAQELGGQPFQSMVANLLYMIQNNQAIQPAVQRQPAKLLRLLLEQNRQWQHPSNRLEMPLSERTITRIGNTLMVSQNSLARFD